MFAVLPEWASKGVQFIDCCLTALKHFIIFSIAVFKDSSSFFRAITNNFSFIVLLRRSTEAVSLWSPTWLKIKLILSS